MMGKAMARGEVVGKYLEPCDIFENLWRAFRCYIAFICWSQLAQLAMHSQQRASG
jgi:hypothetical protein